MLKSILVKIFLISMFILVIVLGGAIVYSNLEKLSFLDALYMTVITLTTTGLGDITPSTNEGKIFTIFLLLTGVGLVTYSVSTILSYIATIDFAHRRRKKMEKRIERLSGHTIICGFGRMGKIVAQKLKKAGVSFVVIEKKDVDTSMLNELKYNYLLGDAANDDLLQQAGIEKAQVLISVIDNDSDGLYITLAGRSYNPGIQIIVRANEPSAKKRMIRAGANKVVLPIVMSGLKVAESAINPAVEDFLSLNEFSGNEKSGEQDLIQLADLYIGLDSPLVGVALEKVGPQFRKLIVVGIRKKNLTFLFNPGGSYKFEQGDCLIIMGDQKSYFAAKEKYKLEITPPVNGVAA